MASKSICPACGADIEFESDADAIRCGFCGTDLGVVKEEGEKQLRVLSTSDPQKDAWNEQASQQLSEEPEGEPEGEPVAPGYASSGSAMADPDALSYPAATPEIPVTVDSIPETLPYQEGRQQGGIGGSANTMRWILIGLAVFVVVCIMCACIATAIFITNGVIVA